MQITGVNNLVNVINRQNFKADSAQPIVQEQSTDSQTIPLKAAEAYASPQITQGYKEISTFDVPYIGQGKLYQLANGHKVIILPKSGKTRVSTIVGVGAFDEAADKKQIASLTANIVAGNLSQNTNHPVKRILMNKGSYAYASVEDTQTTYCISSDIKNGNDLDDILKIQFDTLTNNDFSDGKIKKEKTILAQETRSDLEVMSPYSVLPVESLKNLFNLADNGIVADKTLQKIEAISKADLEKFYQTYYRPDNMTTVIIGNVDNTSITAINKYFGKMSKPNTEIPRENISQIRPDSYIKQPVKKDIDSKDKDEYWAHMALAFIGPPIDNVVDGENSIVLGEIIKKRLEQKDISVDVDISSVANSKDMPQMIQLKLSNNKDKIDNDLKELYAVIEDCAKTPPSEEELKIAKDEAKQNMLSYMESSYAMTKVLFDKLCADSMNTKYLFGDLASVSPAGIQNVAKKYFDLNKASLTTIHPNTKSNEVSFKGSAEAANNSGIKEYNLPNNMHVIIDSRPGIIIPSLSFRLLFEKGAQLNSGVIEAMSLALVQKKNYPYWTSIHQEGIDNSRTGLLENLSTMIKDLMKQTQKPDFEAETLEIIKKSQNNYLERYKSDARSWRKQRRLFEEGNMADYSKGVCPNDMTVEGLKTYYANLLKNSQGTFTIIIPSDKVEQVESEINALLSEFPTLKPQDFSKLVTNNNPNNLEKNYIAADGYGADNRLTVNKQFKMIHGGDKKEEAGILLLNEVLNARFEEVLRDNPELASGISSNYQTYGPRHGKLSIYMRLTALPLVENSKIAMGKIDEVIQGVISTKMDNELLGCFKNQVKSDLIPVKETSRSRNWGLEEDYQKDNDIYHSQKVADAIDGINPDDLQKIAQKYLTQHYVLDVHGNKKVIEDNKGYFATLGEML